MKRSLFSIAALCAVHSAMNSASARTLTDTRHADAGFNFMLNANDGNTTATPGGADLTTDSGALQTGLADDATLAKGKIVGDNDSNLQQDQSNDAGNAQQGGLNADTATDTAANKTGGQDTDESVDGRQPE